MAKVLAVIMSVYKNDRPQIVQTAVNSVLNQTFHEFDLHIQYDGPIDKDVDELLSSITDSRVHIYRRTQNLGLAVSLNDLLQIVLPLGYNYIARMDADDICKCNRFERQLLYYSNHPEIECLGTSAIEITDSGKEFFKKIMPETHEECIALFARRDCMIHPTVMFRRSFFDKAGLYPCSTYFAEDTMMWANGFSSGCIFGNVPEFLYEFRLDNEFFFRRRGWKHAKNMFILRHQINQMLHFGLKGDFWALAYASVMMAPSFILDFAYRHFRF